MTNQIIAVFDNSNLSLFDTQTYSSSLTFTRQILAVFDNLSFCSYDESNSWSFWQFKFLQFLTNQILVVFDKSNSCSFHSANSYSHYEFPTLFLASIRNFAIPTIVSPFTVEIITDKVDGEITSRLLVLVEICFVCGWLENSFSSFFLRFSPPQKHKKENFFFSSRF